MFKTSPSRASVVRAMLPAPLILMVYLLVGSHRYCEHNPNPAFSSCSIAQELTNEQIDAENNGSDAVSAAALGMC